MAVRAVATYRGYKTADASVFWLLQWFEEGRLLLTWAEGKVRAQRGRWKEQEDGWVLAVVEFLVCVCVYFLY